MITITFQATNTENLIRQITAFVEKTEGGKTSGQERKSKPSGKHNANLDDKR